MRIGSAVFGVVRHRGKQTVKLLGTFLQLSVTNVPKSQGYITERKDSTSHLGTTWKYKSIFTTGPNYLRLRSPDTHWMGPRPHLTVTVKKKFLSCRESNTDLAIRSQ